MAHLRAQRNVSLVILIALIPVASGTGNREAACSEPLRVLILSGKHNHNWQETTPLLKRIYEESGRFVVDVTNDPASCNAETFASYDVVVSNWTSWPSVNREWGEETEKAFLEFVRNGKGFALFHAASATFDTWTDFQQLIGATWRKGEGGTGHGQIHTFEVIIADKDHPITRGMNDFFITDELWDNMGTQPNIHVLCTAFSSKETKGSGKDEPVAICTQFGKGRCFNLVLGHDTKAMENVNWKMLMLRGTEWAATGSVIRPNVSESCSGDVGIVKGETERSGQ